MVFQMDPINNKFNPFKQTNATWLLELFNVSQNQLEIYLQLLEEICPAISYDEIEETNHWNIQAYFDEEPNVDYLKQLLNLSEINIKLIDDKDWVEEVQKDFTPFIVEVFYVHNSLHSSNIPESKISLLINPGRAFGTGEHETTTGCLSAISSIKNMFSNNSSMLDMGCGTGILAIALAKLWKCKILAVDLDPQSVFVAEENAGINHVKENIICKVSDGYCASILENYTPFDLIVSNILANPLISFAHSLASNLKNGGIAIISGFLDYQEEQVLNAHKAVHLTPIKTINNNGWITAILKK